MSGAKYLSDVMKDDAPAKDGAIVLAEGSDAEEAGEDDIMKLAEKAIADPAALVALIKKVATACMEASSE